MEKDYKRYSNTYKEIVKLGVDAEKYKQDKDAHKYLKFYADHLRKKWKDVRQNVDQAFDTLSKAPALAAVDTTTSSTGGEKRRRESDSEGEKKRSKPTSSSKDSPESATKDHKDAVSKCTVEPSQLRGQSYEVEFMMQPIASFIKGREWFCERSIPDRRALGNLYVENYSEMCFPVANATSIIQEFVPPHQWIVALALCDDKRFSHEAEWSTKAFELRNCFIADYPEILKKRNIMRTAGNALKTSDFARYEFVGEQRKRLINAVLVRCLRVLLQSECKLFYIVATRCSALWPYFSAIKTCTCTHADPKNCAYVQQLTTNFGYGAQHIVSDAFDLMAEIKKL